MAGCAGRWCLVVGDGALGLREEMGGVTVMGSSSSGMMWGAVYATGSCWEEVASRAAL